MTANRVHVAMSSNHNIGEFNEGSTFSFSVGNISLEIIHGADQKVYENTGRKPIHFLVGLHTYYELVAMMGERCGLRFYDYGEARLFGVQLIVDTTRKHFFAACPNPDWQIGRPILEGTVWTA